MLTILYEERKSAMDKFNTNLITNLQKIQDIKTIKISTLKYKPRHIKKFTLFYELYITIKTYLKIEKEDVILFTEPKKLIVKLFSFLPNKKYVILHHIDENDFNTCKQIPMLNLKNTLLRYDKVFCPSEFTKNQVSFAKTELFNYGLDHTLFYQRKIKEGEQYILSVGTERPRKNMENILKAFKIIKKTHPEIKLIKMGIANKKDREKTLAYIKQMDIKDVIFKEYLEWEEIPSYYSNAKLLLFPSLLEGGGFPPMEAMACGCPVVTSDLPPMNEISIGQLLVDPKNQQEIADACNKILNDEGLRKRLIVLGLERAKTFDWSIMARKIIKTIREDGEYV